jgi:polyisoprenoid-binding protein YceI
MSRPNSRTMKNVLLAMMAFTGAASAAPVTYEIDSNHTYPSFEADHMGMSIWRGKINKTTGTVTLDRDAGKGNVKVDIDLNSIDFGQEKLNEWARGKEFFDTAGHPQASYSGELSDFKEGAPTRVDGKLTLHGVTKPVELKINSFKCRPHPMFKRDWCGADAYATFNREEFGLTAGKDWGFDMNVVLRIQVEAVLREDKSAETPKTNGMQSK